MRDCHVGDWESLPAGERYLPLKEGAMKHVLAIPFELFEILMGFQSRAKTMEIENHEMGHVENRVICDIEHNGKNDWRNFWEGGQ